MQSRQLAEKNFLAPLQFSPAFSALENDNNLARDPATKIPASK